MRSNGMRRAWQVLTAAGRTTALTVALAIATAGGAHAATLGLQGRLIAASGAPVPDGDYALTLSFYKNKADEQPLYVEVKPGVKVSQGVFAVQVGSVVPLDLTAFQGGDAAWVGLTVGSEAELPRTALQYVPYAIRALVAADVTCTGCVGAGELAPDVLAPFVKSADLATIAKSGKYADLVGTPDLEVYAKLAVLAKVATSGSYADLTGVPDLAPYAKTADLGAYAKLANLAKVASSGAYADLTGAPDLAPYAKTAELSAYAKLANLAKVASSGAYADLTGQPNLAVYAKTTDLAPYAKTTDLAPYAKTADLAPYAKTADLAPYAKTADLSVYAKIASLAKVATTGAYADLGGLPDLSVYAKTASLAKVATTGAYADLGGLPDLTVYAKTASLAKVATTGAYPDLANKPTLPVIGSSCGTGLWIKGYKADGSLDCAAPTTYTAGAGLVLSGTTFSLAAPSATSLGGVNSGACTTGQMVTGVGTDGKITCAAQTFANKTTCPSISFANQTQAVNTGTSLLCVYHEAFSATYNTSTSDCYTYYNGAHVCRFEEIRRACLAGSFSPIADSWLSDRSGDDGAIFVNGTDCNNFDGSAGYTATKSGKYCCSEFAKY